jgi:hypothetical protein
MWRKNLRRVVMLSLVGLAGYLGWQLYDFGKLRGVEELKSLRTEHAELRKQQRDLIQESDALRERNAILERSSQIDQQAAQDIQEELASLQDEVQAAREEVEFYRGIVAPGDVTPGLRIHRFELNIGLRPGEYHYDLVLTQMKHNDRIVTGLVEWQIIGKNGNETRELNLTAVTQPATGHLDFRFRYFQHLTGIITLPEGFLAQQVVLSIRTTGKNALEPIEQSFEWPIAGS